ncbi:molybdopterin-guanine dinucleotide biosynthesis protein MobB [Marinobacterium sp. AK62]|uniref:Molybdopterin-guanine dinucleotide biosynthesis protein MobB n=1 Tax=Marinobacterium alkalitolerans TaxID=1542925 RepID=A0ABS3Z7Y3_9GAMM|nr:molybdopterin-guanine dinucleotide biosynthesis protein MobB [Marinobacterium alkalitolerans]MBP0047716.1 molybdopterin-guanine dinucleotide biosynthesis protein MobB [Marinobacterium alkalitolerans]
MNPVHNRLESAKRSFVTRHADLSLCDSISPAEMAAGDLLLAKVRRIRQHTRIELTSGRRAHLYPDDELILCAGRRYATDQFTAELPQAQSAHLVAAGGIAGQMTQRHAQVKPATEIDIIGILKDAQGRSLNLSRFTTLPLPAEQIFGSGPRTLLVTGTGMNSGKTTLAANLIYALNRTGARVAACKLTGTGSGPDLWRFLDAGADRVMDFTDAGLASTWQHPINELITIAQRAKTAAQLNRNDYLIVELADGFFQQETAALLRHTRFRQLIDNCFIAADCTAGALGLIQQLSSLQIPIHGISGTLTRAPLLMEELAQASGLPVLTSEQVQSPALLNQYLGSLGTRERAV